MILDLKLIENSASLDYHFMAQNISDEYPFDLLLCNAVHAAVPRIGLKSPIMEQFLTISVHNAVVQDRTFLVEFLGDAP